MSNPTSPGRPGCVTRPVGRDGGGSPGKWPLRDPSPTLHDALPVRSADRRVPTLGARQPARHRPGLRPPPEGRPVGRRPGRLRGGLGPALATSETPTRRIRAVHGTAPIPEAHGNGGTQIRTGDTTIFSRVLYQLSYPAAEPRIAVGERILRPIPLPPPHTAQGAEVDPGRRRRGRRGRRDPSEPPSPHPGQGPRAVSRPAGGLLRPTIRQGRHHDSLRASVGTAQLRSMRRGRPKLLTSTDGRERPRQGLVPAIQSCRCAGRPRGHVPTSVSWTRRPSALRG